MGGSKAQELITNDNAAMIPGIDEFINSFPQYNHEAAYLNWILLDEELLKLFPIGGCPHPAEIKEIEQAYG